MSETALGLVLSMLAVVFGSSIVAGIFLIAVALAAFCFFLLAAVGGAYLTAWLWAGYEEDFDDGDDKKFAFDEDQVIDAFGLVFANFGFALASIAGSLAGTATSVASAVANNPVAFIVGIILFAVVLVFSTFSTVIAGFYFEFLACFLHPVWRALIQPILEIAALLLAAVLPVWNIARQLTASIASETILDTLACAGVQTVVVVTSAAETVVTGTTALVFWAEGRSGFSPLDVGPDFFATGQQLGKTIAALDLFAECACEPLFDVAIRPFFSAFTSPQFAQATNSTLGIIFVGVTQNLLKSAIRTAENFNENQGAPIETLIDRPSFNSTFDVFDRALNNTAQVFDLQSGALIQVAYNIIGASIQSCPEGYGLTNTRRCTASTNIDPPLNGTCVAGSCRVPFLVETGSGCCARAASCSSNVPPSQCNTTIPGTSFHPGVPCSSLERPGCGSCCFTDITFLGDSGIAALCFSDLAENDCRVLNNGVQRSGVDCLKGTTSAPFLSCQDVARIFPAPFPQTAVQRCGSCTGPDNSFCQCTTCACSYAVDPLFTDLPPAIAANCTRDSEPNVGESVCIADFSFPVPPAPGAITGIAGLLIGLPFVQTPRYVFNLLTNIDVVFSSLDGRLLWLIDDTLGAKTLASIEHIVATVFRWPAALLATIGEFVAEQPSLSAPLSRSGAFASQALTVSERREIDTLLTNEAVAINIALEIVEEILNLFGNFTVETSRAIVLAVELVVNFSTGTVYGAVETAFEFGFPDPFFHPKRLFGGNGGGVTNFQCFIPLAPGYKPDEREVALSLSVRTGGTCTQLAEAREYCRFAFRQTIGNSSLSENTGFLPIPSSVFNVRITSNIQGFVRNCVSTVPGCAPWVVPAIATPIAPNKYEELVLQVLAIPRTLDPIFPLIGIPQLNKFFTNVTEPLAAATVFLIDPLVHFVEMVSSTYVVCLDFEGVLDSLEAFVRAFTSAIRAINDLIKAPGEQPCVVGLRANEVRLFCAIAQAIDSATGLVVELVRIGWLVFTSAARLLDGSRDAVSVASMFSLEVIEVDLRDLIFSSLAVVFAFVPDEATCARRNPLAGCCLANVGILGVLPFNPTVCLDNQLEDQCANQIRGGFPRRWVSQDITVNAFIFGPGETCAQTIARLGGQSITVCPDVVPVILLNVEGSDRPPTRVELANRRGCCLQKPSVESPNGESFEARQCIESQTEFLCQQAGEEFLPNQSCIGRRECPPQIKLPSGEGNSAEVVLLDAISTFATDLLLLFARIPIGVTQSLIVFIAEVAELPDDLFKNTVAAVLQPLFQVLADTFVQIGRVFECIGEGLFGDVFELLADFFDDVARVLIDLVSQLLFATLLFVVGIVQVFTKFEFTLLARAFGVILRIIIGILFGFFGQQFTCGIQGFACDAITVVQFFGIPITTEVVNFASKECRELDCCLYVIEPKDGLTANCGVLPGDTIVPDTCLEVSSATCAQFEDKRKRSDLGRMPFALFVQQELSGASLVRKRSVGPQLPNDAFCGAFLAGYGVERARAANDSAADSGVARACLSVLERDSAEYERAMVSRVLGELAQPYVNIGKRVMEDTGLRWAEMYRTAEAAADAHLRAHTVRSRSGLAAADAVLGRKSRKRTLGRPRNSDERPSLIIEAMYLRVLMERAASEHGLFEKARAYFWSGARKRSLPEVHPRAGLVALRTKGTAMRVAVWRAKETLRSFTSNLVKPLGRFLKTAQWRKPGARAIQEGLKKRAELVERINSLPHVPKYHHRFGSLQNGQVDLIVGNDTLEALGLPSCAVSGEQAFCTDCVLFDNLVHAGTIAVRSAKEYYPNSEFGFLSLVDRFETSIENTLVDPIGTDTYTTTPKRVPWLGERFLTVRWFWQWDYSELLAIIQGNGPPVDTDLFVGQTRLLQREHELLVGRADVDNNLLEVFGTAVDPLITAGERVVSALQGLPSTTTVLALYERYFECDYEFALQCRSDLGIGLFDALANFALVYAIFGLIIGAVAPFGGLTAVTTAIPVLLIGYFGVLWVAYGASPLCTLPSLFFGIFGIPACLPSDIALLFNEAFPQCPWVPISLIEPSALIEASQTLCATCGTTPPLLDCAPAAGFLNGFDNLFYTLTAVFGGTPNRVLETVFSLALPPLASLAALYTPEYVASLGDLGAVCNRFTFLAIATTPVLIATLVGIALAALALIAFLAFAVAVLYYATLAAVNVMISQIDEGFVQGTRVRKLKQQ